LFWQFEGSSLCLVFGLENAFNFFSSIAVFWRFLAISSVDDALERRLRQREERASMAISGFMVLFGFSTLIASIDDFARGKETIEEQQAVVRVREGGGLRSNLFDIYGNFVVRLLGSSLTLCFVFLHR
jgi:hypothetical protein